MNMFGFRWHSFLVSSGAVHRNLIRCTIVSRHVASKFPRF